MPDNTNHIPKIMGILNVTPDSFFPDSRLENISTNDCNFDKADILDIGFESSRPGAMQLDAKDEIKFVIKDRADFYWAESKVSKYKLDKRLIRPTLKLV